MFLLMSSYSMSPLNASVSPVVKKEYSTPWEKDPVIFVNYGMQLFRNISFSLISCPLTLVFFSADSSKILVSTDQTPFKKCRNTRIWGPISREKLTTYPLSVNFY